MIITRTPTRISFGGGGSDYPEVVRRWGGLCVGGALRCYSTLVVRRLPAVFPYKTRLSYSKIETVKDHDELEHRAARACLKYKQMDGEALEISYSADMPARCGLGSSSSFVVGLLLALSAHRGAPYLFRDDLAADAVAVEQGLLAETVGSQDQYLAAAGGLQLLRFHRDGEVTITPVVCDHKALGAHLLAFHVPRGGTASEVASGYAGSLASDEARHWALVRQAEAAYAALQKGDWEGLGAVLSDAWRVKRLLSPAVSSARLDDVYNRGRLAGAWGGKLLGAGGGGVFLFVVPAEKQGRVRKALAELVEVPVRFDLDGARVIFADRG